MRRWFGPAVPFRAPWERVDRFRARHRLGERITGTFLAWQSHGLGWVDFQGTRLLASMASRPEVGSRLHFLIKQLFPDVVLQELTSPGGPGTLRLMHQLQAEQDRMETILAPLLQSAEVRSAKTSEASGRNLAGQMVTRLFLWQQCFDQNPDVRAAHHRLRAALEAINAQLGARGIGRFFTLPWLADQVSGAGLLLGAGAGRPPVSPSDGPSDGPQNTFVPVIPGMSAPKAVFTCTHPFLGPMEIHFTTNPDQPGWALHMTPQILTPRTIDSVSTWLEAAFPLPDSGMRSFRGVHALPSGEHTSLLARLLLAATPDRPRLHIQV